MQADQPGGRLRHHSGQPAGLGHHLPGASDDGIQVVCGGLRRPGIDLRNDGETDAVIDVLKDRPDDEPKSWH